MKKLKLIIALSIAVIASDKINAQTPGYLGKRFLVGYGLNASPVIFGSSANNTSLIGAISTSDKGSAETGVLALNVIHEGYVEFAKSNRWMICLSGRFYKTTYDNAKTISLNTSYSYDHPTGYYDIKGRSFCLYFKYFGKRYVAPWGRYILFGPVLNTVSTTYDPNLMYVTINDYGYNGYTSTKTSNFGPQKQNFAGLNLMLGWGRTRIIADRVTLDYGCNFQLFSLLAVPTDVLGINLSENRIPPSDYIETTSKIRVRGVNRFNVFLKVGVLLF